MEQLKEQLANLEKVIQVLVGSIEGLSIRITGFEERLDRIEAKLDLIQFNFENVNKKLDFVIDEIVKIDGVTRYVDSDKNLKKIKSS